MDVDGGEKEREKEMIRRIFGTVVKNTALLVLQVAPDFIQVREKKTITYSAVVAAAAEGADVNTLDWLIETAQWRSVSPPPPPLLPRPRAACHHIHRHS